MQFLFGEHDVTERVVVENASAFAFLTNSPIVPGHTLICPKRQVPTYEELTSEEKTSIEDLRVRIKKGLKKTFGAEGFNYAWNEKEIGGQSVPHFHLHIVPRKQGDSGIYQYEPREFLYRPGTRETAPENELVAIAKSLRSALESF
jgi:diadenosine tetraphosphate (Ap4A) HIT family hydrolase